MKSMINTNAFFDGIDFQVVQRAYRARQARRVLEKRKARQRHITREKRAIKHWSLEYDSTYGRNYWYVKSLLYMLVVLVV
jgi:hypothetical protein